MSAPAPASNPAHMPAQRRVRRRRTGFHRGGAVSSVVNQAASAVGATAGVAAVTKAAEGATQVVERAAAATQEVAQAVATPGSVISEGSSFLYQNRIPILLCIVAVLALLFVYLVQKWLANRRAMREAVIAAAREEEQRRRAAAAAAAEEQKKRQEQEAQKKEEEEAQKKAGQGQDQEQDQDHEEVGPDQVPTTEDVDETDVIDADAVLRNIHSRLEEHAKSDAEAEDGEDAKTETNETDDRKKASRSVHWGKKSADSSGTSSDDEDEGSSTPEVDDVTPDDEDSAAEDPFNGNDDTDDAGESDVVPIEKSPQSFIRGVTANMDLDDDDDNDDEGEGEGDDAPIADPIGDAVQEAAAAETVTGADIADVFSDEESVDIEVEENGETVDLDDTTGQDQDGSEEEEEKIEAPKKVRRSRRRRGKH